MSTPLARLQKLRVPVTRVIHVGASRGQEVQEYADGGIEAALFVEPLDDAFAALAQEVADRPGFVAAQAACAARDGERLTLHVASNAGESSSILRPAGHLEAHPRVTFGEDVEVVSRRLDSLAAEHEFLGDDRRPLLLTVDVQGAELHVLEGGPETLARTRAAWIEVSHVPLYEGNARFGEVTAHMARFGLELVYCNFNRKLYGDALYLRL